MIPRIIHQLYLGTPPTDMVAMMGGIAAMNPTWQYRFWNEDNLPLLGLDYGKMLDLYKKPVHVGDVVRLVAVHKFGGVYLDCDCEAIRPLDPLSDMQVEAAAAYQDETYQICTAAFGAVAGHYWLKWQIDHALDYSKPDTPWAVDLMTQAPRSGVTMVSTDTFYPWLWNTPLADRKPTTNTLAMHHWKGTWAPWFKREIQQ